MKQTAKNRFLNIILCVMLIFTGVLPFSVVESKETGTENYEITEYENNEIIVTLLNTCSAKERAELFDKAGVIQKDVLEPYYVVKAETKGQLKKALDYFQASTYVVRMQPNFTYEETALTYDGVYSSGNYTHSQNQWALKNEGELVFEDEYEEEKVQSVQGVDVNIVPLWETVSKMKGKEVIVALLDSGVELSHKALQGKLWKNKREIIGDGIDNDGNGYVDDYDGWNAYSFNNDLTDELSHGTHCAGIIAANGTDHVWGVTGNSNIMVMPVKVFSNVKNGDTEDVAASSMSILRGIKYAYANGAQICNMSLGMEKNDVALQEYMRQTNMLFVCAAGNDGRRLERKPLYPAYYNFSNIISVANIRCDGTLHDSSNYSSSSVTVAAPGTEIYSTLIGGRYGYCTGTSMATPYVTGIAAMLYSYSANMNPMTAKNQIISGGKPLEGLSGKVQAGLINAYQSYLNDVTAPQIKKTVTVVKAKGYATIKLNVKDYGNAGLSMVKWMKGSKTAEDFKQGASGTKVSAQGTIKATSSGYYTIYALDKEGNETVSISYVSIPAPTKIIMKKTDITIKRGKTYTLLPKAVPSGIYATYTFSSSNDKVAAVNKKGKITAKKAGTAVITIKTQNNKKLICHITVK